VRDAAFDASLISREAGPVACCSTLWCRSARNRGSQHPDAYERSSLLLPGVTHIVWQPDLIGQLLTAHVRFFRRWLSEGNGQ
jgi:hypothetical protein